MAVTLTTPNTILGALAPKSQATRLITNAVIILAGTALIALAAKINVPTWPVPVTLQSFAIAALAAAFGARIGALTVLAYLLEGAAGLPVFAGASAGIPYLMGPTGGFLLGFVPFAFIIGTAADMGASGKPVRLFIAMLIADAVLFALGFAWLVTLGAGAAWLDASNVIGSGFAKAVQPFLVWDALKMLFAAHPLTDDRRSFLEALDTAHPNAKPAFSAEEWEAIRNMCPPGPPPPLPAIVHTASR